jgi:intracellular multiplication protein IcmE
MVKFKFGSKDPAAGSAKGRAVIFFVVIIILVILAVGYLLYRRHAGSRITPQAGLVTAPGIQSVPGVGQTSTEYVRLQQQQNVQQAQIAAQQGTAAVPTITRVSYFGPAAFTSPAGTSGKTGCHPDELMRARTAGVTAEELRCKGCSLADLKAAGYTAGELAQAGFTPSELKNAGFTPSQLRQAGFTAAELKRAGFSPRELAQAGYSPGALAQAGFSNNDIKNAGYNPADLAAAGIGIAAPSNLPKDCNIDSLKRARAQGISAAALKKLGCGATALRAAGYTAADLRKAGFTPEELKAAGFSPQELKAAGFTAGQLRRAGFNANDLKNAGFTPADLKNAGFSPTDLKNAGFSPNDLKNAGYTSGDLLRAGYNPSEVLPSGQMALPQQGGVGSTAIGPRGVGPANCSVEALRLARAQGISATELKSRGCNAQALLAAGYTPAELKAAGYTDGDLAQAGLTPAQVLAANAALTTQCSVEALRRARAQGMSAVELKKRGCSPAAMLAAGYTPAELKAAGYTNQELRAAGVPVTSVSTPTGVVSGAAIPSVGNTEIQLSRLQASQERQLNEQQRQQKLAQVESSMVSQANSLFSTWTPPATQEYVAGEAPKEEAGAAAGSQGAGGGAMPAGGAPPAGIAPGTPPEAGMPSGAAGGGAALAGGAAGGGGGTPSGGAGAPGGGGAPGAGASPGGGAGAPGGAPVVPGAVPAGASAAVSTCAYVKAGDIMMGVLNSTVNSDDNSPVIATIVSGKLRGAKLIGQFTLLKNRVLINFTKMNLPGKPATIAINAVAIDPQTAHTALADCVNNHYLLRYGTLFASSFLSGLATAISQQGTQIAVGPGGIMITRATLNTPQTLAVALGTVGTQYASSLSSNFTRPPTVYVYAGNSIGILFMQDLVDIPAICCPDIDKTCNGIGSSMGCCTGTTY